MILSTNTSLNQTALLHFGDQGAEVLIMQYWINRRFAELGVDAVRKSAKSHSLRSSSIQFIREDGIFGPQTRGALKFLQCIACLEADGIAGEKTTAYLTEGPHGLPCLQIGSAAPELSHIQRMYNIPSHSKFDLRTKRLIKTIQNRNNLFATGILDVETWTALLFERVDAGICDIQLTLDSQ